MVSQDTISILIFDVIMLISFDRHTIVLLLLLLFSCSILCSCSRSSQDFQAALQTLNEADSLRSAGRLYSDSLSLAKAHSVLSRFYYRHSHPYEYARINYFYGRMLDSRNSKTEAMQCFINATHTATKTPLCKRVGLPWYRPTTKHYNLLGSVYCNIGIMCHASKQLELSYEMFELSAQMFKEAQNINAYYYALDDMAFESASLRNKKQTISIVSEVLGESTDSFAQALAIQSLAELYLRTEQYDSALYFADKLSAYNYNETTTLVVKAQSYSMLGIKDSAVYYARKALEQKISLQERISMYYILQHDDISINKDSVNQLASDRTDMLRELDARHRRLAQSLLLLEQDMHSKPNYGLLLFVIIAVVILLFIISYLLIKSVILKNRFSHKSRVWNNEKKSYEQELNRVREQSKLYKQDYDKYINEMAVYIEQNRLAFLHSDDLNKDLCWNDFDSMCDIVNKSFNMFVGRLKAIYNLNESEVRLCVLILLNDFNGKYLSGMLNYGENGIRNLKSRTARKVGSNGKEFHNYLVKFAIGGCERVI